jgi:hypothetical protein
MEKSYFYNLGKEAAGLLKSSLITGTKPIRVRHKGKFMGKAPGSTKTAPHHEVSIRV